MSRDGSYLEILKSGGDPLRLIQLRAGFLDRYQTFHFCFSAVPALLLINPLVWSQICLARSIFRSFDTVSSFPSSSLLSSTHTHLFQTFLDNEAQTPSDLPTSTTTIFLQLRFSSSCPKNRNVPVRRSQIGSDQIWEIYSVVRGLWLRGSVMGFHGGEPDCFRAHGFRHGDVVLH